MDPSVDGPLGMDPLDIGGFEAKSPEMDEREMLAAAEGYGEDEYALPSHEPDPGATTTQLAEQYPQIDTPLRVDPPAAMKVRSPASHARLSGGPLLAPPARERKEPCAVAPRAGGCCLQRSESSV